MINILKGGILWGEFDNILGTVIQIIEKMLIILDTLVILKEHGMHVLLVLT